MNGVVKWFNSNKGFGFIEGEDGNDYFVHFSNIDSSEGFKTVNEGDEVIFSPTKKEKGLSAEHVSVGMES